MWLALWAAVASANPCPDLGDKVDQAWALFDDAEIESAKATLVQANGALSCQTDVVLRSDLLALFRLDGLVSLALDDRKSAIYATIRAVAVDHQTGAPPAKFGPDLAELYGVWSDRLGAQPIVIRVQGGGDVYIDGRQLDGASFIEVAEGEHLVQVVVDDVVRSELVELTEHFVVATGAAGAGPVPMPFIPSETPGTTPPVSVEIPVQNSPSVQRRHPKALLISGLLLGAAGGGGVAWAFTKERSFNEDTYDSPGYQGCAAFAPCYAQARDDQIQKDAGKINLYYGLGYGLSVTGATLVGIGLVGVGSRDMRGVSMSWAF